MRVLYLPRWACPDAGPLPVLHSCLCWARPHWGKSSDFDCAALWAPAHTAQVAKCELTACCRSQLYANCCCEGSAEA